MAYTFTWPCSLPCRLPNSGGKYIYISYPLFPWHNIFYKQMLYFRNCKVRYSLYLKQSINFKTLKISLSCSVVYVLAPIYNFQYLYIILCRNCLSWYKISLKYVLPYLKIVFRLFDFINWINLKITNVGLFFIEINSN